MSAPPPPRSRRKPPRETPTVVRRPVDAPQGLRRLPPEVEDLASGRSDYLRRPKRPDDGRIHDERIAGLIPGVPNHEARRVLDARVARLREALGRGDDATLARMLHDTVRLALWRARNVQGFDALCEGVLSLPSARGQELLAQAREECGEPTPLPDAVTALWLRTEAAVLTQRSAASVELSVQDGELRMSIAVPVADTELAAQVLAALGHAGRTQTGMQAGPQAGAMGTRGGHGAPPRSPRTQQQGGFRGPESDRRAAPPGRRPPRPGPRR